MCSTVRQHHLAGPLVTRCLMIEGLLCPGHVRKDPPKRIDFLLSSLMPVSAELVMDSTAAGMRLSDHLGLKTVFACNAALSRKR